MHVLENNIRLVLGGRLSQRKRRNASLRARDPSVFVTAGIFRRFLDHDEIANASPIPVTKWHFNRVSPRDKERSELPLH